jgi:hypothetical protein
LGIDCAIDRLAPATNKAAPTTATIFILIFIFVPQ